MNLYLHNIGDIYGEIPITQGDDCKCVLITEGIVEINGKIKSKVMQSM